MADTLGGFNLQSTGFSNLVQVAIHRSTIENLRTRGVYAIPESLLKLGAKPGSTFVRRGTLWTDVSPTLSALSEGVVPDPLKMAEDDIEVTVSEVGDYIPVFSQADY